MTRRVMSITGTRADYGLMRPVFSAIQNDPALELHLVVTGMHFLPAFQNALEGLHKDAYGHLIEVPVSDTESSVASMAKTLGAHIQALVPVFEKFAPDMVLLQGDRGEMLAGAIAAAHLNIPVIHMSGGDFSGSIDDSIRHAITKFAHFHLPTCTQSRDHLLAMGEEEARIRIVGEPALDILRTFKPTTDEVLTERYGVNFDQPLALVAQHPVTSEADQSAAQMAETLEAVKDSGIRAIITAPNSDAGGADMMKQIEFYAREFPETFIYVPHLGQQDFFSMMHHADMLIGNTSAGILESPSFKLPAINIGTRQHARLRASNVIDVDYDRNAIANAIDTALNDDSYVEKLASVVNPYGQGDTSVKTVDILKNIKLDPALVTKWVKGFAPL